MSILLNNGANINAKSNDGQTPRVFAKKGDKKMQYVYCKLKLNKCTWLNLANAFPFNWFNSTLQSINS